MLIAIATFAILSAVGLAEDAGPANWHNLLRGTPPGASIGGPRSASPGTDLAPMDTVWSCWYNGPGNDIDYGYGFDLDSAGNSYLTGQSIGAGTSFDFTTMKVGPDGTRRWVTRWNGPGTGYDYAYAVKADRAGNVYVTGTTDSSSSNKWDIATVKYDSSGNQQWLQRYSGPANLNDQATTLLLDAAGNVYVTGFSESAGTGYDLTVIKYTPSGSRAWVGRYTTPGDYDDQPTDLALDSSGNVIVTGVNYASNAYQFVTAKFSPTGGLLWARTYRSPNGGDNYPLAVAADRQGGIYVTGATTGPGNNLDYTTVKYDPDGTQNWVARYAGPGNGPDYAQCLAPDRHGNVYVSGYSRGTSGNYDWLTIKYDPVGETAWTRRYTGTGWVRTMALSGDSAIYVAGPINGRSCFARYDSLGNLVCFAGYSGPQSNNDVYGIGVDRTGNVLLGGYARSAVTNYDYLVLKFAPRVDVAARRIVQPAGTIDSGTTVTPSAWVANQGGAQATFPVRFRIGTGYLDSILVTDLATGDSQLCSFTPTVLHGRGALGVGCTTGLTGDRYPSNNALNTTVSLDVRDFAATAIARPNPVETAGVTFYPRARFRNNGVSAATAEVRMEIPEVSYRDERQWYLTPGQEAELTFNGVTLNPGEYTALAYTMLPNDLVPHNDTFRRPFTVLRSGPDVGVVALLAPDGTLDSGTVVTPVCSVSNSGSQTVSFTVRMKIGSTYETTHLVSSFAPGARAAVTFPTWTALPRGTQAVSCSTELTGDILPANDSRVTRVTVAVRDYSARAIVAPVGVVPNGPVTPQVKIRNNGSAREAGTVMCRISALVPYLESLTLASGLPLGVDTVLSFPDWTATTGRYAIRCSVYLAGDQFPADNVLADSFSVRVTQPGWTQRADMPLGSRSRYVADGGALAYTGGTGAGMVYAFKGNNRYEFYAHDLDADDWETCDSIPAIGSSGRKKAVKKGASLAAAAGSVYAVKGNNSVEFWRYDPAQAQAPGSSSKNPKACGVRSSWSQLPDVPLGTRTIREGTGMATVVAGDTEYIYLLKGSGTQEFYRYNPQGNTWETRADAPLGTSGKLYKNGSCIAWDGDRTIYALKGSYNEFYAYDIPTNTWSARRTLPFYNRLQKKTKVKDGAGLARLGDQLYALKGNNTQEFWFWRANSDTWVQETDIPLGGGKRVKGGGRLIATGERLYALKGNKTVEFWQYEPSAYATAATEPARNSIQSSPFDLHSSIFNLQSPVFNLQVSPNPLALRSPQTVTRITYSLPQPGHVSLKLYDITGKAIATLFDGSQSAGQHTLEFGHWDLVIGHSRLARGVFVLKLETEIGNLTRKLVIQ